MVAIYDKLQQIYDAIARNGFATSVLQAINNYIKDIRNGTENFSRFNLSVHAGLCKGGAPLIGASIIADYARTSLTAGGNAASSKGSAASWEIDERQEQLIEQWAMECFSWGDYPTTMPAHDIIIEGTYTDGVNGVRQNSNQAEFYSLDGKKMKRMQRGVNIVRRGSRTVKVRMGNEIMK